MFIVEPRNHDLVARVKFGNLRHHRLVRPAVTFSMPGGDECHGAEAGAHGE